MLGAIAILGCGKIGESLLAGLLSSGWREPSEVVATVRRDERAAELRGHYGVEVTRSNTDAVAGAGLVVVAVKPQDIAPLLGEVGSAADARPDRPLGRSRDPDRRDRAAPRRAVPGRPRDAERAVRSSTRGSPASAPARTRPTSTSRSPRSASRTSAGVVRVAEPYMDAVTAVSGSGPAYFALLAEAMIEAGILLGLSREISTQLVVQTMLGTAKLLRDEHMHPVELREAVTSPGGTTIRAIRELERAGVRAAFLNAIQAAMERSKELARGRADDERVEILVVDDPAEVAAQRIAEAVDAGGHIGLSGGSGPRPAYERVAAPARLERRRALVDRRALRPARRRQLELPPDPRVAARRPRRRARRCTGSVASSTPGEAADDLRRGARRRRRSTSR